MTDTGTNPLMTPSTLPYGAPPLDLVKPEHFLPALKAAVADARKKLQAIKENADAPSFENTIEALEFFSSEVARVYMVYSNFAGAYTGSKLEAFEEEISEVYNDFANDVTLDPVLFERVKQAKENTDVTKLTVEQAMLLKKTYENFASNGAFLPEDQKATFKQLVKDITNAELQFDRNKKKSANALAQLFDSVDALDGVPESIIDNYRKAAEQEGHAGKFLVRMLPPPSEIFAYCKNRATRAQVHKAYASIGLGGETDNSQIVLDIARMRTKKAKMLGYETHAHYMLRDRMEKDPQKIIEFLATGKSVYKPAAEKFLQEVKDFAARKDGITDFKAYDTGYYSRLLKEETFKIDTEQMRQYFKLENVLEGLRQHAEKLFSVNMTEVKGKYPVYDPDVKVFEVTDKKTGELMGVYYNDYFARSGKDYAESGTKRAGAWMSVFRDRGDVNGVNMPPLVGNFCNFAKPREGKPTLLSFREVETVVHEFGHAMNGLLAKGKYASINGTNCPWDFVELHSQVQENWFSEKEVLKTFAFHHETGAPMPDDMIEKIGLMSTFGAGSTGLAMTHYAALDMAYHYGDPEKISSMKDLEAAMHKEYGLLPHEYGAISTAFGHIFSPGGYYAAGYYCYDFARVLDADVFEEAKRRGLYDADFGIRLRDIIYAQGGAKDPMDIFIEMMGRKPDQTALYRREGLVANDTAPPKPPVQKSGGQKPAV